jgi:hypothetical protein
VSSGAAHLFFNQEATTTVTIETHTQTTTTNDGADVVCITLPTGAGDVMPPAAVAPPPPPPPPMPDTTTTAQQGTFSLCGPDAATEDAIEQLIAGRGFSATLVSTGNGCAQLTLRVSPQVSSGTASSNLSVSLGSGRQLTIAIVSEGGATRASIGAGN